MDTPSFRRLINTITKFMYGEDSDEADVPPSPELDELFFRSDSGTTRPLNEALLHSPSGNTIRVDQPRHGGGGQVHGHILGRKGKEIGVVNLDGTGSHGTKMRLNKKDAQTLRDAGFIIQKDRMVEWIADPSLSLEILLG